MKIELISQITTAGVLFGGGHLGHHLVGDAVGGLGPRIDDLVVLLALGDQAVGVLLLVFFHELAGLGDDRRLALRDDDVVLTEGDAGLRRFLEAQRHDLVGEDHRRLLAAVPVDDVDQVGDFLLREVLLKKPVSDRRMAREERSDLHPAR